MFFLFDPFICFFDPLPKICALHGPSRAGKDEAESDRKAVAAAMAQGVQSSRVDITSHVLQSLEHLSCAFWRDDLDFYKVICVGDAFWRLLDFLNRSTSSQLLLEHRSQDWVCVDDDRFATWTPQWRTLQQFASRSYSGAGISTDAPVSDSTVDGYVSLREVSTCSCSGANMHC